MQFIKSGKKQLAVAVDYREQVVEIVRDASGHSSQAFELLGLDEFLFQPLTVGDIEDRNDHTRPVRARRADQRYDHTDRTLLAMKGPGLKFRFVSRVVIRQGSDLLAKDFVRLLIEDLAEIPHQLLFAGGAIEVPRSAVDVY